MPRGRPTESAPKPAATAPPPVPTYWESVLEEEPSSLKGGRAPGTDRDDDLPPPPRVAYRKPEKSSRRASRPSDVNVGPIIGWFLGLSFLVFVGMLIWVGANGYSYEEARRTRCDLSDHLLLQAARA